MHFLLKDAMLRNLVLISGEEGKRHNFAGETPMGDAFRGRSHSVDPNMYTSGRETAASSYGQTPSFTMSALPV